MFNAKTLELALDDIRTFLLKNEIGPDQSLIYKFSDPDGYRTGRSGWSFGCSQFDLSHNSSADEILEAAGFDRKDIDVLVRQTNAANMDKYNAMLLAGRSTIDHADFEHMRESFYHCLKLVVDKEILLENFGVLYHLVDYHNQFSMSPNGKIHRHLQRLNRTITSKDILTFKLKNTLWGRKRPDDVNRRYENVALVIGNRIKAGGLF